MHQKIKNRSTYVCHFQTYSISTLKACARTRSVQIAICSCIIQKNLTLSNHVLLIMSQLADTQIRPSCVCNLINSGRYQAIQILLPCIPIIHLQFQAFIHHLSLTIATTVPIHDNKHLLDWIKQHSYTPPLTQQLSTTSIPSFSNSICCTNYCYTLETLTITIADHLISFPEPTPFLQLHTNRTILIISFSFCKLEMGKNPSI